jgi:hypothetical protein
MSWFDRFRKHGSGSGTSSQPAMPSPLGGQGVTPEGAKFLMEMVSDTRYNQEAGVQGVMLAAPLKEAVMARGLVGKLNGAYGWNLPADMTLNPKQLSDVIYEIVTKPGYSLDRFLAAIQSGRRL